ncbi:glycerate dehydrogenase [Deinococcus arenae]|uniref:Glycerate dehydrogenase n=1 Tax=Deinococcus arenae TaxID=1452751 RepID=A0A8H9L6V7_9DEIO|nr:DUF4147 domain-containing protein [Deinococcus arenae]AWT37713.1 glycerate kinase [Deinococcus actinosclerus]GGM38181.1 glycerate dehydrogenase [Deinococcus arenae]
MHDLLLDTYRAALAGTEAGRLTAPHLDSRPAPAFILSVGKAGAGMLRAALARFPGVPALLVVPDGAAGGPWPAGVEVHEAGHPTPDARSVAAARRALSLLGALSAGQEVLVLLSGGGSALLCAPRGVTLAQKAAVTADLMRAGADIHALNTVRRALSDVKGGRLAAATPARVRTLLLSDVVGDDPAVIASGPTVPSTTTPADALAVLDRFGIRAPAARAALGSAGPPPVRTAPTEHRVIGGGRDLLAAAAAHLRARGWPTVILGDTFTGEARDLAAFHAALIRAVQAGGGVHPAPVALLSGGEATVTVRGAGRGGRNTEFALALALALGEEGGVDALSAGSDGVDGTSGGAGALLTPDTLRRVRAAGLDARAALDANDSGALFAALGDLIPAQPSGQNLNDLRVVLIGARDRVLDRT